VDSGLARSSYDAGHPSFITLSTRFGTIRDATRDIRTIPTLMSWRSLAIPCVGDIRYANVESRVVRLCLLQSRLLRPQIMTVLFLLRNSVDIPAS
jgi:hypothetical protein